MSSNPLESATAVSTIRKKIPRTKKVVVSLAFGISSVILVLGVLTTNPRLQERQAGRDTKVTRLEKRFGKKL